MLSNRKSRRRFARTPPELDAVQRRIVAELDTQGYAELPFGELFPSGEEWAAVDAWAEAFVAATERDLAGEADGTGEMTHRREGKEFVIRRYDRQASIGDDPWFALCQSRRMLDIANAYLRMWSKLEYVDLWYTPPVAEAKERVASQHWHRDFQDRNLLKAFLYLVDVDEGAGPFEYVPGSAGRWAVRLRVAVATARDDLSGRRGARRARARRRRQDVHRLSRHADLLQHERLPSRRFRDRAAAGARDGDVPLARFAGIADRAELRGRRA